MCHSVQTVTLHSKRLIGLNCSSHKRSKPLDNFQPPYRLSFDDLIDGADSLWYHTTLNVVPFHGRPSFLLLTGSNIVIDLAQTGKQSLSMIGNI